MAVSVSSIVATAVKDANVIIAVSTTVLAALSEVVYLPIVPAADTHWITGAIVAGGVFVKLLKDVVADLAPSQAAAEPAAPKTP